MRANQYLTICTHDMVLFCKLTRDERGIKNLEFLPLMIKNYLETVKKLKMAQQF